jgi:hypothetical protein
MKIIRRWPLRHRRIVSGRAGARRSVTGETEAGRSIIYAANYAGADGLLAF